jgi:hypothetical protein
MKTFSVVMGLLAVVLIFGADFAPGAVFAGVFVVSAVVGFLAGKYLDKD